MNWRGSATLDLLRCCERRIVAGPLPLRNGRIHGVMNRRGTGTALSIHTSTDWTVLSEIAQPHFAERHAHVLKSQKLESSDPPLVIVRINRPPRPGVIGQRFTKTSLACLRSSGPARRISIITLRLLPTGYPPDARTKTCTHPGRLERAMFGARDFERSKVGGNIPLNPFQFVANRSAMGSHTPRRLGG